MHNGFGFNAAMQHAHSPGPDAVMFWAFRRASGAFCDSCHVSVTFGARAAGFAGGERPEDSAYVAR